MYNNPSISFPFELVRTISLDGNDYEVIDLSFVLPGLHLNILETEKMLQFRDKTLQAQEVQRRESRAIL